MKIQFTEEQKDKIEAALLEMLPHGSGIDCKWEFDWNERLNDKTGTFEFRSLKCSNSFHCMSEHGYYDGYADFSLTIYPLKALTAFRFQFHGKEAQRKNKRYQLRDFLEDTLYHALDGNKSLYEIAIS